MLGTESDQGICLWLRGEGRGTGGALEPDAMQQKALKTVPLCMYLVFDGDSQASHVCTFQGIADCSHDKIWTGKSMYV